MGSKTRRARGFPNQAIVDQIRAYLLERFSAPPHDAEEAVRYANMVLDRQISKASGLLSYNALLLGSFSLITHGGSNLTIQASFGSLAALVSAGILLILMWMHWGDVAEFQTPEKDLESAMRTIKWRTCLISLALLISGTATMFAMFAVAPSIAPYLRHLCT